MKFEQNQHIKCVFKNGTLIEGLVESWTKEEVVLTSLDGESKLIIMHPDDDIMLIKLVLKSSQKESVEKPKLNLTELEEKLEEVYAQPSDDPNRITTMAELKIQLSEAEKQITANKLKDWNIKNPNGIEYKGQHTILSVLPKQSKRPRDKMTGNPVSAYDLSAIKRNWKGKI